uniref:Uncharacterized protein n=1 Tax=Rhizophagus irregularis (strain DAOM 181602 / DAOM 197198 / MUCL 43194) TaxID=747089 RepID=U9UIB7_RHIID
MFWNNGLQIGRIFDEEKKGEEYIIRHYIVISNQDNIDLELLEIFSLLRKRKRTKRGMNSLTISERFGLFAEP